MNYNPDCARDLMLYLAESVPLAKRSQFKLKNHLSDAPIAKYSPEDIFYAARVLQAEKLFTVGTQRIGIDLDVIPADQYVIIAVTGSGFRFAEAVRSNTVWNKLSKWIKASGSASFPVLLQKALEFIPPV